MTMVVESETPLRTSRTVRFRIGAAAAAAVGLVAVLAAFWWWSRPTGAGAEAAAAWELPAAFQPDRSMDNLRRICAFGPRPSGSDGMRRQQRWLAGEFQQLGAGVEFQAFEVRHPIDGSAVTMANLIARWHVDRPRRILLCAHYDTRPYPDQDPVNPRGIFVGANDGASGVAALLEVAHQLAELPGEVGVDIVLFDGEEFVFDERGEYFLGSTYFARQVASGQWPAQYEAGVLLDMVGDRELTLFYEKNSWRYAREVTREIWETAGEQGIDAFLPRVRHEIRDDHIPLNRIAEIPTTDIIDFDYPRPGFRTQSYWHTRMDTPDKCSGRSLAAVAHVVHQWLIKRTAR